MNEVAHPKTTTTKAANQAGGVGNRGLGTEDIWQNALKKFKAENRITETELKEYADAGNLEYAETGVQKATQIFEAWRHPPGPETDIMEAVSGCLTWVDTAAGFIKDHVSGTYATPAQLITGAVSKMIKAAKDISEDFDLIQKTFTEIHEAVKDIRQLDAHAKNEEEETFVHRLTEIFIAIFEFSFFSSKIFEASRKRRYFRALLKGRDKKIQEKCDKVTQVILLFRANVPFKILSEVEKFGQTVHEIKDEMPDAFRRVIQGLSASDLLPLTQRSNVLEKVKRRFGVKPAEMSILENQMLLIKSNYVEGTFLWLEDNPEYKDWFRAQKTPFLCVSGPSGSGKTYLTYRCYELLQAMTKHQVPTTETTKNRQAISVAYFFFDPGSQTHSLKNALENLIVQIASQDSKYCDSLAKDIDKTGADRNKDDNAKSLWTTFLSSKFDKTPEVSRMAYILLDGVDLLSPNDLSDLLDLFQGLGCDQTAIQIMMTGIPEELKEMNLRPCEINLVARTKQHGDIKKIIANRMEHLKNLKEFSEDNHKKILDKLSSQSDGIISFVDLTLSVMDQSGDEDGAMKQVDGNYSQKKLYDSMIEVVMEGRSPNDKISIPTLLAWTTYAKERLSVHEIQQVWEIDPSLSHDFKVLSEIQVKSKIMLYTTKRVSAEGESENGQQQLTEEEEDLNIQQSTGPAADGPGAIDPKLEVIEFRQSGLRTYLDQSANKMIEEPLKAKIQIFTTLCKVLCDSSTAKEVSRKVLHKYAVSYFVNHLLDVDLLATTPQQGRDMVESLSKVLSNENNVCKIFEAVMHERNEYSVSFQLYDVDTTAKRILAWAKKMSFYEDEELSDAAKDWIESTVQYSGKLFEPLAKGHVENLSKKVLVDQAWEPYRLAYHALVRTGRIVDPGDDFHIWYLGRINTKSANAIIEFATEFWKDDTVEAARIRIALALLLNTSLDSEDRKLAADLYNRNLQSDEATPGPEKFYSYVGLAEFYAVPLAENETQEETTLRWEKVVEKADLALQQRQEERGALGSELNNERYTAAFWLKADATHKLDHDELALQICTDALACNELEYSKKNKRLLDFYTLIIKVHAKKNNYYPIITLIRDCEYTMRAEWLWHRWDFTPDKNDSLRKAAVMTNRVDFLIQVYEEAIAYHKDHQNWLGSQMLTMDLSIIYRRDARATRMAEITLTDILKEIKDNESRPEVGDVLWLGFPLAVDLLYENYHLAKSKTSKEAEAEKLYKLILDLGSSTYNDQMSLAEALLTLAKMLKGIGKIRQARSQIDKAFNLCMDDLGDLVTYNDKTAFRKLGKILMFADLKVDAEIALSLQNSEVDRSHEDAQIYQDMEAASIQEDAASVAVNGVANTDTHTTEEDSNVLLIPNGVEPEVAENLQQSPVQESKQKPLMNSIVRELDPGSEEEAAETPEQQPKPNGLEKHEEEKPNGALPKPWSEDLIPKDQRYILCNGPCTSRFDNFQDSGTIYFCVDCHDVDFCSGCYEKQVLYHTKTGEGFWFKCCWAEHQYIKQPVDGWRGVKNGIIRIGSKEKPFKSWLTDVRNKWNVKMAAMR